MERWQNAGTCYQLNNNKQNGFRVRNKQVTPKKVGTVVTTKIIPCLIYLSIYLSKYLPTASLAGYLAVQAGQQNDATAGSRAVTTSTNESRQSARAQRGAWRAVTHF